MGTQFGKRIKTFREEHNLLQRHVASQMEMDTPLLSKIERGERIPKKEQVLKFAQIFKANYNELLTLWLADQVVNVVKNEEVGLNAIQIAENEIKFLQKQ